MIEEKLLGIRNMSILSLYDIIISTEFKRLAHDFPYAA